MKKILLTIVICFVSAASFGQDPELVGTWYIIEHFSPFCQVGSGSIPNSNPPIQPYLTILDDGNPGFISGFAGCNNFSFVVEYHPTFDTFDIISDDFGTDFCTPEIEEWEDSLRCYFSTAPTNNLFWNYQLTMENGVRRLRFHSIFEQDVLFQSIPLPIYDVERVSINLYPNPATSELFIAMDEGIPIYSITIYSVSGERITHQQDPQNTVNISDLPTGLYFIEAISDKGREIQKFIKN